MNVVFYIIQIAVGGGMIAVGFIDLYTRQSIESLLYLGIGILLFKDDK